MLASEIRRAQIKVSTANGDCVSVEDSTTDNHAEGSCCRRLCRLGESETDTCRTSDRLTQLMSSATFTAESLLCKGEEVGPTVAPKSSICGFGPRRRALKYVS